MVQGNLFLLYFIHCSEKLVAKDPSEANTMRTDDRGEAEENKVYLTMWNAMGSLD